MKGLIGVGTRHKMWDGVGAGCEHGYGPTPSVWEGHPGAEALKTLSSQECLGSLLPNNASKPAMDANTTKPRVGGYIES